VVGQCRAVLAVIGSDWLDVRDETGARRLESGDDFVRIELEAALARGVPLIPVLVSGAVMPTAAQLPQTLAEFAYRQGTAVRPDPDFHRDMDRLVVSLQAMLPGSGLPAPGTVAAQPRVAPGPTGAVQRTNLPRNLPSLIGRAELVAAVHADLRAHPLVTLAGFGGIGKTRLAQQVGAEATDQLAQGVWFVDLAGLNSGADVVPTVARTFGVREYSSESLEVTLIEALREREMLVILDNCERFTAAVATFVEQLTAAAPNVRVLSTSREPLGVYGEKVVRVQGLEAAAAADLFTARASQIRSESSWDPRVVARLCQQLDFVPLAIELAAAHVRSLTPAEILARVSERVGALRATDRRTARHQTLESLVAWSYDLLTEPEQRLLNRLSVFVGTFDLASAERVCAGSGVEADEVVELLDRLVDKSLVFAGTSRGASRFRLMGTVSQYAARKLAAAGEQAEMFDRHVRHFSTQAQSLDIRLKGSDARGSSAALLSDIDNLNAALDRLGQKGQHTEKATLVVALSLFWQTGAIANGRRRYEELLAVERELTPEVRFLTLLEAASFFSSLGFATQSVPLLDRARAAAAEHDLELPPYFFYVAAQAAEMDGRVEEVLALCDAGKAVLPPDDDFNALTLRARSLTSILKVRPAEALAEARGILRQAQECGLDLFVSVGHMLAGTVLMMEGRAAESEPEFARAIELAEVAMPQVTISALVGSAAACRHSDPQRSMERARQGLDVEAQSDIMPWFRVIAAYVLAWHWASGGRADDAARALAAMDELRRRLGFAGVWWGEAIRAEAWEAVCAALPPAHISELRSQGGALTVTEVRTLLAAVA
jgi:predicted ATPase